MGKEWEEVGKEQGKKWEDHGKQWELCRTAAQKWETHGNDVGGLWYHIYYEVSVISE